MGQIDVTMNVDPGTQTLYGRRPDHELHGHRQLGSDTVVASQNLGADKSRRSLVEAAAAPVQLSFNTASFNATTGAVSFKNGTARSRVKARTAAGTQSGSNTEMLGAREPGRDRRHHGVVEDGAQRHAVGSAGTAAT